MTQAPYLANQSDQDITGVLVSGSNAVPADRVMPNMSLESLLTTIKLLLDTVGVLRVENRYHSWRVLLWGGTIALIEEEADLAKTLLRKLRGQKLQLPDNTLPEDTTGVHLYEMVNAIYNQNEEAIRPILKEILFENLLSIYLENNFTCVWHPLPNPPKYNLPTWKFSILDEVARRAVEQWKQLQHIRHPSQTVQLLDKDSSIANLPLFAKVTNGKFRITEIADEFKQHISRTAQKLDKLAETRTVAIMPLRPRSSRNTDQPTTPDDLNVSAIPQVMVVDDSPVQLKQLGELLKTWGYRTQLIGDPRTVTQIMLEQKPSIAFMDINMPGITGFELIKEIRKETSLKDIELVLITSADNVTNKFRASWAKCRFLAKPKSSDEEHIQEFRHQLRQILREIVPLSSDVLV